MLSFVDKVYPFSYINHEREIVRCVLLDADNKIVLECIKRDDEFGHCEYVETPGGGLKPLETHIQCLKREVREELGYEIEVLKKLDDVVDYYNLLHRKNINHYYLAKIVSKGESNLEELEKTMFVGEIHLTYKEAVKKMNSNFGGVGELVRQREMPILDIALKNGVEL